MKLDDLKAGWKTEVTQVNETMDITQIIQSLEKETKKFDKHVKRRDILEISIALLLIPVWVWKLFYSASVIQSVGLLIAIVACVFIPYKLVKAKQVVTAKDNSILANLLVEKNKLENQKNLLESIAIWYISPLMVAIVLITAGARVNEAGLPLISETLVIYYGFCALLVVGVYLLNKRAAANKFDPLLDKVNRQISELKKLNEVSE